MTGTVTLERRMDDATVRSADVALGDLRTVIDELSAVPGGVAESPFAADAIVLLEESIERAATAGRTEVPDGQAEAIDWALERLTVDGQGLSPGLHELRQLVAP